MVYKELDEALINWLRKSYIPLSRFAIFVVYYWFGLLKLLNLSPANPIAYELTARTIGLQHFVLVFHILGIVECAIGILFLIPKATRIVIPLLLVHIIIVSSPLLLVTSLTWAKPLVPTLEGQYIIKNIAIVVLALGVAAQTRPFKKSSKH